MSSRSFWTSCLTCQQPVIQQPVSPPVLQQPVSPPVIQSPCSTGGHQTAPIIEAPQLSCRRSTAPTPTPNTRYFRNLPLGLAVARAQGLTQARDVARGRTRHRTTAAFRVRLTPGATPAEISNATRC